VTTAPTPERLAHDRIAQATDTIADADGSIGQPWLVESMLQRMYRRGDIGPPEWRAGEEFARLFRRAHLDPLKATDMGRDSLRSQIGGPHGSDRARRRVMAALDALGGQASPCGSCAWFVLGCEFSVRQWALREGWGGKPLSETVAKGTLLGTLGVLAKHFGL